MWHKSAAERMIVANGDDAVMVLTHEREEDLPNHSLSVDVEHGHHLIGNQVAGMAILPMTVAAAVANPTSFLPRPNEAE